MAYTKGWAQRRAKNTVGGQAEAAVNATLDTSINPADGTYPLASHRADAVWQVTAGQSVSIRWGGRMFGTDWNMAAANRAVWTMSAVYETSTQGTNLWETAATDSATVNGSASGDWTLDRTVTFTASSTGTIRLYARARVEVIATSSTLSDINTDAGAGFGGPAETFPAADSALDATYGLVRCGTTLTSLTPSGFTTPASYPDTVSLAFVTGHAPRFAVSGETHAVSWRSSSDVEFQLSTIATGTVTALPAVTDGVDETWPAASDAIRIRLTPANSPLSTANGGTGLPWIHWTSIPSSPGTVTQNSTTQAVTFAGAFTADARLTADLHFQVDDDAFGVSKHDTSQQMLFTQSGFVWPILRNARSEGVNSLTVSHTLDPVSPGTTISTSGATSTQDGQAGVGTRLDWTASKPGGRWDWAADVTAPSTIDVDTHLIQSGDSTTLLSKDPRIEPLVAITPIVGIENRHLEPGDSIKIAVTVRRSDTRKRIMQDSAPTAFISRYDRTAGWQYLATNGTTWTAWSSGVTADAHTLVQETDTLSYALTFGSTTGWAATDLVAVDVVCLVGGTPYPEKVQRELVGNFNRHDAANTLDSLADVDTSGVASGDVLFYDGAQWRDEHMPTAAEVANAVWDELTAEARPTGSYGKVVRDSLPVPAVDPAVIVNATWDELISEARTAGSYGQLLKDRIDAAISSRAAQSSVTALGSPAQAADYTAARAVKLDLLDVAVSTRSTLAQVTAAQDAILTAIAASLSSLSTQVGTPAQAAALTAARDTIVAAVNTRATPADVQVTVGSPPQISSGP